MKMKLNRNESKIIIRLIAINQLIMINGDSIRQEDHDLINKYPKLNSIAKAHIERKIIEMLTGDIHASLSS